VDYGLSAEQRPIENAQAIAAHESPRNTKPYDRTTDEITLDEIERIGI
jgi:integrase/recombinase XerD